MHGFRNDPFQTNSNLLQPDDMAAGLSTLAGYLKGVQSVGIVHAYRDESSRDAFLKLGGTFAAMFRNPYERIHSLFTHHYMEKFGQTVDSEDIYTDVMLKIPLVTVESARSAVMTDEMDAILSPIEARFENLVRTTLVADVLNLARLPDYECILFEKMHKDQDYLVAHLERVTKLDRAHLAKTVSENRERKLNKHIVGKRLQAREIYEVWPPSFRAIFDSVMERMGKSKVSELYSRFDYEIY